MTVDFDRRRRAALDLLAARRPDADGLLVTSLVNVRYLSGFTGSNAVLLLRREADPLLGTDGRYVTQAGEECPDLALHIDRVTAPAVLRHAEALGVRRLAFESEHVTVAGHADLGDAVPGIGLDATRGLVEDLRATKDDDEVALIEQACRISDAALADLLRELRPGLSERWIARRLEALLYSHGADAISFDTIVAGGPHSAVPHHEPTDRPVAAGDLLKLDFGAAVGGYHADETRTVVVGAEPADWQREVFDLVAAAQRIGRERLRAGVEVVALDAAVRDLIEAAGHGEHYGHGLGHGVGLEIHEAPMVGPRGTGRIGARSTVTVEPGVYLPGHGGVRIEDTLLVTSEGAVALTTAPRDLISVG